MPYGITGLERVNIVRHIGINYFKPQLLANNVNVHFVLLSKQKPITVYRWHKYGVWTEWESFSDAISKLRKKQILASSCLSVCLSIILSVRPSVRQEQLCSHWTNFHGIYIWVFFENMSRENSKVTQPVRPQRTTQHGTCALHAASPKLQTHTQNM